MAMRRNCVVGIFAFVLGAAAPLAGGAGAGGAPEGFGPPVLDGVEAGADHDALTDYRFAAGQDWPALRFRAPRPLDWSRAGALAIPVDNADDAAFRLLLRIDDRADADGDDRSLTGTIDIPAHAHGTVLLPLDAGPIGMVARPPSPLASLAGDLVVRQVRGAVDLTHVVGLHVSGVRGDEDRHLSLGTGMLRPATAPARQGPLVDAFGQAIDGHWPEKVASDADLRAKLKAAAAQTALLARSAAPSADRFGGLDPGTRLKATGFFRVERAFDRWSLVTPAGHRFFSLGVDAVMPSNPTLAEGRRELFAVLPPQGDPLARYGVMRDGAVAAFDFGPANIERGLGPGWRPGWRGRTVERLEAWGFNTLGNWSSPEVTQPAALPFVEFYDVEGDSARVPMPGGRDLQDPFDPRFAAVADRVAAAMTAAHRADPMLLGYFSGNELPWGSGARPDQGIAAQVFGLGPDSPARQAMIEGLRRRYGGAAAFASAWGLPPATTWDDVTAGRVAWPTSLSAGARRDIADFQRGFALRYFGTVAAAIKRHDPNHLYLGTRFADAPPEVVEACARLCDVMSFNVYGRSPNDRAAEWRRFDRPVLIGEFHFGSTDRGSFWPGMVEVASEAERGPAYAAYVADAVEDRQIVGVHWYQYADEPLTGRPYDGENGHIGLVSVADVPYAGFVAEVAAANAAAARRFAAEAKPDLRGTQ